MRTKARYSTRHSERPAGPLTGARPEEVPPRRRPRRRAARRGVDRLLESLARRPLAWLAGSAGIGLGVGVGAATGLWHVLAVAVAAHTDTVLSALLLAASLGAVWRMSGEE